MKPHRYHLLVPFFLATAGVVPLAEAQTKSYYPSTIGMTWSFSNGETQKFIQPQTVKGLRMTTLMHSFGSQIVQLDYLEYSKEGVFLKGSKVGGKLTWYEPKLMLYPPSPITVGLQWKSSAHIDKKNVIEYVGHVVGQEAVVNPAGRFNAFVIRTDIQTSSGAQNTLYTYFVPTLGPVKWVTSDGTSVNLVK